MNKNISVIGFGKPIAMRARKGKKKRKIDGYLLGKQQRACLIGNASKSIIAI